MPQPVSSATVVSHHLPAIVFTHMANALSWELFIPVVFATVRSLVFTLLKTGPESNNQVILSLLHSPLHGPSHPFTAVKQWMGYSSSLPPQQGLWRCPWKAFLRLSSSTAELKKFSPGLKRTKKALFLQGRLTRKFGHYFTSFCHAFCFCNSPGDLLVAQKLEEFISCCVGLLLDFWCRIFWIFLLQVLVTVVWWQEPRNSLLVPVAGTSNTGSPSQQDHPTSCLRHLHWSLRPVRTGKGNEDDLSAPPLFQEY